MNFFETAREMEKQTRQYYLDLAEKCVRNEGLKNILQMLAEDHEQHMQKLREMEDDECSDLQPAKTFDSIIKVFRDLQKKKETFSCDIDQLKMYQQAHELLQKKMKFYLSGKSQLSCPKNQAVLTDIIAEEQHQIFVLENIIEMVERPQTWIEDAEFTHLQDY